MAQIQCRHFNGYKPCGKSENCDSACSSLDVPQASILIVHLGALGAVVRATSLLMPIKRKFPRSRVTWVTDAPAHRLLEDNPLVDRVLTTSAEDQLVLRALTFDVAFAIDKSLKAAGVLALTQVDLVFGFVADPHSGAILPSTPAAEELWSLGLSNQKKFFENKKTETQLMVEALELGAYHQDDYYLPLKIAELEEAERRHSHWKTNPDLPVVGLNTGCANTIPAKKWTVEFHRKVIEGLLASGYKNLVLLGGPEDSERNRQIAEGFDIIETPTKSGLRDGLISVAACDLVITGDSLGMHMAIAMKKYVIAWFGPTCAHEIELYGRGIALKAPVSCSPCWKRTCEKDVMCYDQIQLETVLDAVYQGLKVCHSDPQAKFSTFKRPFSETSA